MGKRLWLQTRRLLFYVGLDVAVGVAIYAISLGEAGLSSGQLAIRVLTGMALANAIVGGPDIMLYWQESGRRIRAEEERDNAQRKLVERDHEISELRSLIAELQERVSAQEQRPIRRSRRRLRNNGR